MSEASEATLIWSAEHGAYWRADCAGYTTDILAAGVYSLADAEANTKHCGPEKRIQLRKAAHYLAEHVRAFGPDTVFCRLLPNVIVSPPPAPGGREGE